MRPTGSLHLGHLIGALNNWVKLQDSYSCLFMVADWHALMSEYATPYNIKEYSIENVIDWLSCGIDPKRSIVFIQSDVKEHLELNMMLSCITPLGWLERCPTYKEQLNELKDKDINTYAFLGYPVLQAADILLYKAKAVPVGEDQLPHLELTREIARRFNHLYKKSIFPEPEAILSSNPRLLGLDGRKMSKSYQNFIALSDNEDIVKKKVLSMFTDPKRIRLKDPGHPGACNIYSYYKIFDPKKQKEVYEWCTGAKLGCAQCKELLAISLVKLLKPIQERRKTFVQDKSKIYSILEEGAMSAAKIASKTSKEIKELFKLSKT